MVDAIFVGLLIILLLLSICIMAYSGRQMRKITKEVCHKATCLIRDMDIVDQSMIEVRNQIQELSEALSAIDTDSDAYK